MNLKNIFFLAITGILVVACNDINEEVSFSEPNNILSIQSGGDHFTTRFNGLTNKWESGDAIGVFMLSNDNSQVLNDAANVQYTTDQNAESVSFKSSGGIPLASEMANFYAYYPYNVNVLEDDFIYSVDLGDQEQGYSSYDLMWAKKTGVKAEDIKSSGLSLTFSHQMVMIKVNVTLSSGMSDIKSVVASGLNTSAKFNLIDGTLTDGDVLKSIRLYKSAKNTYAAILLPTKTPRNMTLTFYVDDNKYQYLMSSASSIKEFKAGHQYAFNIGLGESVEGNLTEIQGGNTPWSEEGGEDGSAVEVPNNSEIPYDYSLVAVTEKTDLNTALEGTKGKIALVFNNGVTYPIIKNLAISKQVTELLLISENEKQVKLTLEGIELNENLQKLVFNNLEIEGAKGKSLFANNTELAAGGVVEIKNCNFHGMKAVCSWDASGGAKNVLSSFVVDNSKVSNVESLFNLYRTQEMKITNSTLYKISQRAIYINTYDGVPQPTVYVENCTFVDLDKTPLECPAANGNLIYKNNISDCRNEYRNLAYKMNVIEFIGNYAAADQYAATQVHNKAVEAEGAWADTTMERATLFVDADNGNFTTTVAAGDPRWRTGQP